MPTRVGVVGLNARAERLILPGLSASPRAQVTAVCSRDPRKAADVAARLPAALAFGDLAAMLESGAIDALYVNTPLETHADLCRAAIRAGCAVICEKPLAPTANESAALAAAAERAGVRTAVNFTYRSVLGFRLALRLLHDVSFGPLRHAHFELLQGHNFLPDFRRASALLDSGCHLFDLMAALLCAAGAGAVREVLGAAGPLEPGTVPDYGWSLLARTEQGHVISALFTRQALGWRNGLRWTLSGDAAALEVETDGTSVRVRTAARGDGVPSGRWRDLSPPADLSADDARFPAYHMDRLVGAIRGEESFPTFSDALFTNRVADAIARSAREGRWVPLES